jgi:hypothetical protein
MLRRKLKPRPEIKLTSSSVGLERRQEAMVATATIQGIKALSHPPTKGEHYLSINLALTDPAIVWQLARNLGFEPELIQIHDRFSGGIEIHVLLFHEQTHGEPITTPELDLRIDQLAEQVNTEAIRHTYGGQLLA